MIKYILYKIKE